MEKLRRHEAARYIGAVLAIEHEAALADDAPPWLIGLLGSIDRVEGKDLIAELKGDRCDECGQPLADHLRETGRAMNASWDDNRLHSVKA